MTELPATERKSKSQRKREMTALQTLGEELVELASGELQRLALPEKLLDAVEAARALSQRGARKRQMQYIGRLMRDVDPKPIQEALDAMKTHGRQATVDFHHLEHWRERLLVQGDEAVQELLAEYPDADRQHLRQLIRTAQAEQAADKPPRAARELFQYLRGLKLMK